MQNTKSTDGNLYPTLSADKNIDTEQFCETQDYVYDSFIFIFYIHSNILKILANYCMNEVEVRIVVVAKEKKRLVKYGQG